MSESRAISLKEGQPEKMGLMADKLALIHGLRLYRDDLSRALCIRGCVMIQRVVSAAPRCHADNTSSSMSTYSILFCTYRNQPNSICFNQEKLFPTSDNMERRGTEVLEVVCSRYSTYRL